MLVLSRKVGQRIWIGQDIAVTVVRINGNSVRIGIEAPEQLSVVREEIRSAEPPMLAEASIPFLTKSHPCLPHRPNGSHPTPAKSASLPR